jgi:iron complex transport system substrate-binding protein
VATIDDGFVDAVMTHLGVADRVAAIGSWSMKRDYNYEFETADGTKYSHSGWNTMKFLHPRLDDLPCVNSP